MYRRIVTALAVAFALIFVLSACGSDSEPTVKKVETFDGVWTTGDSAVEMQATISMNNIEIIWGLGGEEGLQGLYWKGTFEAPKDLSENFSIVSIGDTEAMDKSLLGSQNDQKIFAWHDGTLSFVLVIRGTQETVVLTKV